MPEAVQSFSENKDFNEVREGARAKDYETAIMWLCDCGLVHKVSRVNTVGIPLGAYEDLKAFKLFVVCRTIKKKKGSLICHYIR